MLSRLFTGAACSSMTVFGRAFSAGAMGTAAPADTTAIVRQLADIRAMNPELFRAMQAAAVHVDRSPSAQQEMFRLLTAAREVEHASRGTSEAPTSSY